MPLADNGGRLVSLTQLTEDGLPAASRSSVASWTAAHPRAGPSPGRGRRSRRPYRRARSGRSTCTAWPAARRWWRRPRPRSDGRTCGAARAVPRAASTAAGWSTTPITAAGDRAARTAHRRRPVADGPADAGAALAPGRPRVRRHRRRRAAPRRHLRRATAPCCRRRTPARGCGYAPLAYGGWDGFATPVARPARRRSTIRSRPPRAAAACRPRAGGRAAPGPGQRPGRRRRGAGARAGGAPRLAPAGAGRAAGRARRRRRWCCATVAAPVSACRRAVRLVPLPHGDADAAPRRVASGSARADADRPTGLGLDGRRLVLERRHRHRARCRRARRRAAGRARPRGTAAGGGRAPAPVPVRPDRSGWTAARPRLARRRQRGRFDLGHLQRHPRPDGRCRRRRPRAERRRPLGGAVQRAGWGALDRAVRGPGLLRAPQPRPGRVRADGGRQRRDHRWADDGGRIADGDGGDHLGGAAGGPDADRGGRGHLRRGLPRAPSRVVPRRCADRCHCAGCCLARADRSRAARSPLWPTGRGRWRARSPPPGRAAMAWMGTATIRTGCPRSPATRGSTPS